MKYWNTVFWFFFPSLFSITILPSRMILHFNTTLCFFFAHLDLPERTINVYTFLILTFAFSNFGDIWFGGYWKSSSSVVYYVLRLSLNIINYLRYYWSSSFGLRQTRLVINYWCVSVCVIVPISFRVLLKLSMCVSFNFRLGVTTGCVNLITSK